MTNDEFKGIMHNTKIIILGTKYKISVERLTENHGDVDYDKKIIRIDEDEKEPDRTLLHEIIHAILHESCHKFNISEFEEGIVRIIEKELWEIGYRLND